MKPDASTRQSPAWLRFFKHESAGGMLLALAAAAALAVSNSPWRAGYEALVQAPVEIRLGTWLTLAKPALVYALCNLGDATALRGWAIPAATDIAFAIGIVVLLGPRVPASLKVFLTAVAIIDDLGAIGVIALFYTDHLSLTMLLAAAACIAALLALNRAGVVRTDVYLALGLLLWLCVLKSGVHATPAGVITALAVPMRAPQGRSLGQSPAQTLAHGLHPWVAFGVLPVFAFCNAGVPSDGVRLATLAEGIPLGIAAGLLLGKAVGVFGSLLLMVTLGLAARPAGASWLQCLGVAVLGGVGFTVSLFIGGLAFEGLDGSYETRVKLGVLAGSLLSGLAGTAILLLAHWRGRA